MQRWALAVLVFFLPIFIFGQQSHVQPNDPRQGSHDVRDGIRGFPDKLPPNALVGKEARRLAWQRLSPEKREEVKAKVRAIIEQEFEKYKAQHQGKSKVRNRVQIGGVKDGFELEINGNVEEEIPLSFVGKDGKRFVVPAAPAIKHKDASSPAKGPACGSSAKRYRIYSADRTPKTRAGWKLLPAVLRLDKEFSVRQTQSPTDADLDALPDSFEEQIASDFAPYYSVSGGETANFARFFNFAPETVAQTFPSVPPIIHYRVKPLPGVVFDAGTQQTYRYLRVDYLTLWNRDNGFHISDSCTTQLGVGISAATNSLAGYVGAAVFDNIVTAFSSHDLDDERSAVLMRAPSPDGQNFSLNAASYKPISFFTAAHEDSFGDRSAFQNVNLQQSGAMHKEMWLSLSKHATYTFNPEGLSLVPDTLQDAVYAGIVAAFMVQWVYDIVYYQPCYYYEYFRWDSLMDVWMPYMDCSYPWEYWSYFDDTRVDEYLAALFIADTVFNDCFVEHHYPGNPWTLPGTEINVGELSTPINDSGFIGDPAHAGGKLIKVLWPELENPVPPAGCDDICNPECANFDAWGCCPDPSATACCQRFNCIYP